MSTDGASEMVTNTTRLVAESATAIKGLTELTPIDPAFPHVIASGPGIHDDLVALLERATEGL